MDLTESYLNLIPAETRSHFDFREVRNGAAIIAATNPDQWQELVAVLAGFTLKKSDILESGGNKSGVAKRLDGHFRKLGWRESRVDTRIDLALRIMPWTDDGEKDAKQTTSTVENKGYKVDNFKGRIALDVEWNAKDGNLDRDLNAYEALYEFALIDAAILITRTQEDLRQLALRLDPESTKFATTTSTNIDQLESRLKRGDAGGCPILAIAISSLCYVDD